MERPLWRLLSEDPSDLTCDQCFAVMEYYAEVLARRGPDVLSKVLEHLRTCPNCEAQHREVLRRLLAACSERSDASPHDLAKSTGPGVEE